MPLTFRIEVQPIDIHLHVHNDSSDDVKKMFAILIDSLNQPTRKADHIMTTLDEDIAKLNDLETVEDGVVTLLTSIKAQLDASGTDATKLQALSDGLDRLKAKASAAIVANTPADPSNPPQTPAAA